MANFTVADGLALQQQVAAMTTQMTALMRQNETITGTFDTFRTQATQEIQSLKSQLAATAAAATSGGIAKPLVSLPDLKDYKPDKFSGKRDQDYKPWRKRFVTYCKLQCPGFRAALQWVEKRTEPIDSNALAAMAWEKSAEANPKLWDFLSLVCTDDALELVETAKEQGLEAWRLLHKRYAPSGGRHELTRMTNLLRRKACASLRDLPAAADQLEADFRTYNTTTGYSVPQEWKLPMQ